MDEATTSLHHKLYRLSLKRFKPSQVLKAMKWALYHEKQLNRLIEDVKELVDGLIELFPAAEPARRQLCAEDRAELASDINMALLEPIIAEQDPELGAAIQSVKSDGTRHKSSTLPSPAVRTMVCSKATSLVSKLTTLG